MLWVRVKRRVRVDVHVTICEYEYVVDTEEEVTGDLDTVVLCEGVFDTVVLCVTVGVPFAEEVMGGVPVCRGVADTVFDELRELVWVVLWVLVFDSAADRVEEGELVLDRVGLGARETVAEPVVFVEPVVVWVREGEEDIDTRWVRDVLGERVSLVEGESVTDAVDVLLVVVVREMVGVDVSLPDTCIEEVIVLEEVVVLVAVFVFVVFAEAEEVRVPANVFVPVGLVRIVGEPWAEKDVVLLGAIDRVGVPLVEDVLL